MYTSYFRLTEAPFSLAPDPRYLFMSERHREGLAHLLYGIRQPGGFVQLTGEVGTGKTTLCRCLLKQLPPEIHVAMILNPRVTAAEFLATLCDELRIPYPANTRSIKVLVDSLYRHLLDAHAAGRRTVLIIDEAQNLPAHVLEQIRLLTNLETTTEKLLQIILIGQPELVRILDRPRLRQLAQRITARYHLLPFSKPETFAYIQHRLRVAGGGESLFAPRAMAAVHRLSGGVPRLINVICDRALLGAYAGDARLVDAAIVRRAAREVQGSSPRLRAARLALASGLIAIGAAAVVLGGSILWTSGGIASLRIGPDPTPVSAEARQTPDPRRAEDAGRLVPAPPALAGLLARPSVRADRDAAYASVFSRWGVDSRGAGAGLECEAGRPDGLACLPMAGSWNRVRRIDLPAILALVGPTGERHPAALLALDEETATLGLGGRELTVPLREIDPFWDGAFTLVWKPPPITSRLMALGGRGKDVIWLRERLDKVQGKKAEASPPAVYDDAVRQRVVSFQQSRSLDPDGVVGEETLLHLTLSPREPGTPSLIRPNPPS